jgi:hypothetical protein
MAVCQRIRCPACGFDRKLAAFGITLEGVFDAANAQPNELSLRVDHIGGRGRLRVERHPLPVHLAIGLRAALRARLAQIDAELAAAGIDG